MPTLKQITCSIECGPSKIKLREHQVTWEDGAVSSYLAVPSQHKDFSIHVTSEGYIAPGLAIFVFIDGVPQCSRNRTGLIFPESGTKADQTEIDFRVSQKEEKFFDDGTWIARPWTFADLNIDASADKTSSIPADVAQNIGTIQIMVLRCYAKESASSAQPGPAKADNKKQGDKKAQKKVVIDQLDGAADGDLQHQPTLMSFDGTFEAPADTRNRPAPVIGAAVQDPRARLPGEDDQTYLARLLAMLSPGQPNNYNDYQTQGHYAQTVPNPAYEAYLRDRMFQQVYQNLDQNGRLVNNNAYPGYYVNNTWNPQAAPQFQRGPVGFGTYPGFNAQQTGRQPPNSANTSVAGAKPESDVGKKSAVGWGATSAEDKDIQETNVWQNDPGALNWDDDAGDKVANGDGKKDITTGAWGHSGNKAGGDWENTAKVETTGTWGDDSGNKASGAWDDSGKVETVDWTASATTSPPIDTPAIQEKKARQLVERKKKDKATDNFRASPAQGEAGYQYPDHGTGQHHLQAWQQHTFVAPTPIDGAADAKSQAAPVKGQKSSEKGRYTISAEPLFRIPQGVVDRTQASHQVQAGRGSIYEHSTGRPKYLDRISKPYAVFTFKYRSRENLANILGVDVGTIKEFTKPMRKKLEALSKQQLIEHFMKAKARAGYESDSSLDDSDVEVVVKRDVAEKSSNNKEPKKAEPAPEKATAAHDWSAPAADANQW